MPFGRPRELTSELTRDIPDKPGVYKILAPCKGKWENGIPRLKRIDGRRILAYGHSAKLRTRVGAFVRSLGKCSGHHEGNLLRILNERAHLRVRRVQIAWYKTENHKEEEERLIKHYVKEYGEVPPLNAAIPKREEATGW